MSENRPRTTAYRTPFGETVDFDPVVLRFPIDEVRADPLLEHEFVRDEVSGRELFMLSVDPDRHDRPQDRVRAYNALDNEILAGVRATRGADGPPPRELPRLVGYHDDPKRPFALLEPYRGEPLSTLLNRRQLFEEEQPLFQAGLFHALFLLRSLELVHRDIRPDNVRWDERARSVQLCGFTSATVTGVPRARVGRGPWASHEQRAGTGRCDHRDDVWSAGLVLVQALTGHDVTSQDSLTLAEYPDLELVLKDVLTASADQRPGADILLRRVTGGSLPYKRRIDEHLGHGRHRFDEERAAKGAVLGRHIDEAAPPEEGSDGDDPTSRAGGAVAAEAPGGDPRDGRTSAHHIRDGESERSGTSPPASVGGQQRPPWYLLKTGALVLVLVVAAVMLFVNLA